jgi:glycosyltransferase involved in cell wall biosynthesis
VATALRAPLVVPLHADHRGATGHLGVPITAVGVAGWPSWLARWRDQAEIDTGRRVAAAATALAPGLVWERHSLFCDAGWKVARACGARWILEVNAPLVEERARFESLRDRPFAEAWERDVLLAADEIVAVSAWLVQWLRGLGCRRVRHLPNGVAPLHGDREGTRRRLGLNGNFVIGFLGSMKPWHGVERIPALLDSMPEAVGLLVGSGPSVVTHPRLLAVGLVDETEAANLVAAMDVGLAPYGADAPPWFCPLKVLAYRAQGTPVVATAVGDCAALVGSGGTVVEPGRLDALVASVQGWRKRERPAAHLRSWDTVAAEGLAG